MRRRLNPQAIIALVMGLFLGGVVFTVVAFLTDWERLIVSIIAGLVPPILLMCLIGDLFVPGPPED